jgi:hypothetical protein
MLLAVITFHAVSFYLQIKLRSGTKEAYFRMETNLIQVLLFNKTRF